MSGHKKKVSRRVIQEMKRENNSVNISFLSDYFGYSRQYFYQTQEKATEKLLMTEIVIAFVLEERDLAPELGSKKLYKLYRDAPFEDHYGRDAFIDVLRKFNLLLKKHQYKVKTTDSNHTNHIYPNLILDLEPTHPNEVWVSDITYIRLKDGFCYLSLITDMYSRRIMGYDLAPDLKYYHVRDALERAITNANMDLRGLIHHSDRGFQYTYKSYIDALNKLGIIPSMTQSGDPLENAIAERINGILKKEWLNKYKFSNIEDVIPALEKAILYYNNRRPHLSLEMNTPDFVYNNPGNYKRLWTETQRYARLKECESVQEN